MNKPDQNSKPAFSGERVRLGDAFDLQMGKTPSRDNSSYWNNGDHEWVSIKDLGTYGKYVGSTKETISELGRAESGIKPVPANTLIMSFKLSLGKTAITTRETYTNEAIMAFLEKGDHEINLDYMWHQFRSKDWTVGTNTAVMGKTLNKKTLGDSTIRIPSLAEQIEIADILDKVLGQIDATNNQVSHLQSLVKSRFVEMFGSKDFDHKPLVKCVSSIDSGKSPICSSSPRANRDPAVLKLSAISSGVYREGENKGLLPGEAIVDSKEVVQGDILLARKNTPELVGRSVYVARTEGNIMFPDIVFRMHPRPVVNGIYLAHVLSGPMFGEVKSLAHGSAKSMSNIPKSKLANLQIPLPPLPLQREFAAFAERAAKLEFVAQQQIEKLQTLYDSLAQEYFG